MGCKDCALRECEGRNGLIVCDMDGEAHEPDYECGDYEQDLDIPPGWISFAGFLDSLGLTKRR